MKVLSLASLLLCSSAAMAHFTLDYPQSRGFDDDKEGTAPCGGFDTVANRTQFPLTNGFLQINSRHVSAEITINVVIGSNPVAADFTTAAGTPANSTSLKHPGNACFPLDLSTFQGAANNTNATIQIVYNGGDSPLYQCSDVVLVTSAPSFDQTKCVNNDGSTSTSNSTTNGTSAGTAISVKSTATAAAALLIAVAMAF
ncbi:hypothetical protein BGZ80_004336 [Entomortierella chlamydospora]|uniref:Copper acquisition factor BIM1-like domain-containing protein n=1 Tax=Entomortierella chlamydospora TaxID=101097 RepID=A0A9P6N1I3_9FUNG|nr:hypothetical protein BGZ79_004776 [Entomortierella chlamydospora]KAG0020367.1 hypothetical protein BGZ80_004336 [Entomortierella chlamydospora]